MPLTPEDVLNKSFTATQFRRGYDEQEVDDFLDEVVAELRRLGGENSELRRAGGAAGGSADPELLAQAERAEQEAQERITRARADAQKAEEDSAARVAKAKEHAEQAEREARATAGEGAPAGSTTDGAADAAGVIALAQRLHDEYVAQGKAENERLVGEGQAEHDQLITSGRDEHERLVTDGTERRDALLAEGRATHDRLVGDAQGRHDELLSTGQARHEELIRAGQEEHDRLVTSAQESSTTMVEEAQQRRDSIVDELERTRAAYDGKISALATFEEEYRGRLTEYIEGHLAGLRAQTSPMPPDRPAGELEPGPEVGEPAPVDHEVGV